MPRTKGYKCSDEARARMSAVARERWSDPEYRERTLSRLVAALRARNIPQEELDARAARLRAVSPEKRSAASKKRWADPAYRAAISEAARKAWKSDPRLIRPDEAMMALIHEYNDGPVGKKIAAINLGLTTPTLNRILRDYGIVWKKSPSAAKTAPEVGHPSNAGTRVVPSLTDFPPKTGRPGNGAASFAREEAA
jgi:hypothetical protein